MPLLVLRFEISRVGGEGGEGVVAEDRLVPGEGLRRGVGEEPRNGGRPWGGAAVRAGGEERRYFHQNKPVISAQFSGGDGTDVSDGVPVFEPGGAQEEVNLVTVLALLGKVSAGEPGGLMNRFMPKEQVKDAEPHLPSEADESLTVAVAVVRARVRMRGVIELLVNEPEVAQESLSGPRGGWEVVAGLLGADTSVEVSGQEQEVVRELAEKALEEVHELSIESVGRGAHLGGGAQWGRTHLPGAGGQSRTGGPRRSARGEILGESDGDEAAHESRRQGEVEGREDGTPGLHPLLVDAAGHGNRHTCVAL